MEDRTFSDEIASLVVWTVRDGGWLSALLRRFSTSDHMERSR